MATRMRKEGHVGFGNGFDPLLLSMTSEEIKTARDFIKEFCDYRKSEYMEVGKTALVDILPVSIHTYQVMLREENCYSMIGRELPDRILECSTKTVPSFKMYSDLRVMIYPYDPQFWPHGSKPSLRKLSVVWPQVYMPRGTQVDDWTIKQVDSYDEFIKKPGMTLELFKYYRVLKGFDWYYDYSDDNQLAMNRRESHRKLETEASLDPLKMELYKEAISTIKGAFGLRLKVEKSETDKKKPE